MADGKNAEMTVFDMYGKRVINQSFSEPLGTLRLETFMLSAGHYLLQIKSSGEIMTKRFVIAK
jgi:hypothetical protein